MNIEQIAGRVDSLVESKLRLKGIPELRLCRRLEPGMYLMPRDSFDILVRISDDFRNALGIYRSGRPEYGIAAIPALRDADHSYTDIVELLSIFSTPKSIIMKADIPWVRKHERVHRVADNLPEHQQQVIERGYQTILEYDPSVQETALENADEFCAHLIATDPRRRQFVKSLGIVLNHLDPEAYDMIDMVRKEVEAEA